MSHLAEYIAAILLDKARISPDEAYGGSTKAITAQLMHEIGSLVKDSDVKEALSILEPYAASESEFSPLTNGFWHVKFDNFRYYFIESEPGEGDEEADYRALSDTVDQHPILKAYARRGTPYANDAVAHLRDLSSNGWDELRQASGANSTFIPASNRIVSLNHNQADLLDSASAEIISAVERENSIDGDVSLRSRIIGQLKAGRELVRAQSINAYLLYLTVGGVLEHLIAKYGGQAIGEAAKKLLDLLIEYVFRT